MKALSIRQPWLWFILHCNKRIENRSRDDGRMPTTCYHRGPLLLHASRGCTREECEDAIDFVTDEEVVTLDEQHGLPLGWPGFANLPRGGIAGRCNVVGHVTPDGRLWRDPAGRIPMVDIGVDMRWHVAGSHGLVLAAVESLPFVPLKGSIGLFNVPDNWLPGAYHDRREDVPGA